MDHLEDIMEQVLTPEVTIDAEVSQTAAGLWRGSVKVKITAPFEFDSSVDIHRNIGQIRAEYESAVAEAESQDGFPDASFRTLVDPAQPQMEPAVLVTAPTVKEIEIRTALHRLLVEGAFSVQTLASSLNSSESADVSVKPKKESK